MIKELVSVIIPTYNRANCIERSIRSVLNQTYQNIEVIVVDDHSSDNTQAVVDAIEDDRIRYIYLTENRGVSGARNYGIAQAGGRYIAFQDSDDFWYEDKLQVQMEYLLSHNYDFVFCRFKLNSDPVRFIPGEEGDLWFAENNFMDILVKSNVVGAPTILVKKDALEAYGMFDENLKTLEDWDLAFRMALHARVGYIDKCLVDAAYNSEGINSVYGLERAKSLLVLLKRYWSSVHNKELFVDMVHTVINLLIEFSDNDIRKCLDDVFDYYLKEQPVLSVVVPVYNVERYLAKCLDSILSLPISNIEVVCVNDGSTDSSAAILDKYSRSDGRIRVIHKENTGYGDSMNRGISSATGYFVGMLESDDFFNRYYVLNLCFAAFFLDAKVAKGNYNLYYNDTEECFGQDNIKELPSFTVISPANYNKIFECTPTIWSAVYKRSLLIDNGIGFLPTPGASYQDTSFAFKIWALADRVVLTKDPIVNYCQDNTVSSSNSISKVFAVCAEFAEIEQFLFRTDRMNLYPAFARAKFISYAWNSQRLIDPKVQIKFWLGVASEFHWLYDHGYIIKDYWDQQDYDTVLMVSNDIYSFCRGFLPTSENVRTSLLELLTLIDTLYIHHDGHNSINLIYILKSLNISFKIIAISTKELNEDIQADVIDCYENIDKDGLIIVCEDRDISEEIIREYEAKGFYNCVLWENAIWPQDDPTEGYVCETEEGENYLDFWNREQYPCDCIARLNSMNYLKGWVHVKDFENKKAYFKISNAFYLLEWERRPDLVEAFGSSDYAGFYGECYIANIQAENLAPEIIIVDEAGKKFVRNKMIQSFKLLAGNAIWPQKDPTIGFVRENDEGKYCLDFWNREQNPGDCIVRLNKINSLNGWIRVKDFENKKAYFKISDTFFLLEWERRPDVEAAFDSSDYAGFYGECYIANIQAEKPTPEIIVVDKTEKKFVRTKMEQTFKLPARGTESQEL